MFTPPMRFRHKLEREDHVAAIKTAAGQYLLGCFMVMFNLLVSFSGERFRFYFLPIILMFVVSCLISFVLRLLWQRDANRDEAAATVLVYSCILLSCIYWHDFVFNQRQLGSVYITNIFQTKFTIIHLLAFIIAAFLIPHDYWFPLRVAAILSGVCLLGAGMPDREVTEHERYVIYLSTIAVLSAGSINLDVARSFRAWSASSPHATIQQAERILSKPSFVCGYFTPIRLLRSIPRMFVLTWQAQVLWLSGWPAPPESLDPKLFELGHLPVFRKAGVRYLVAALAQASIFAAYLVALPPALSTNPYQVFALELFLPPFVQYTALWIYHGWFFFVIDEMSRPPRKGAP